MLYDMIAGNFGLLLLVGLIGLAIWLGQRDAAAKRSQADGREHDKAHDRARDARWLEYIGSFRAAAGTDRERKIIDTMLAGGTVDELRAGDAAGGAGKVGADNVPGRAAANQLAEVPQGAATVAAGAVQAAPAAGQSGGQAAKPLDGTLLLLYFGAFLFVASAGLFVAFGDFSGAVRTLLVVLTMAVMYGGGLWLYDRSERLKPAGLSFVAIGLAIAPLVGVAAYNYLSAGLDGQLGGRIIWLMTSLLCLGLYGHAMYRLRTTLLPYLFIASFVSLFESGIAVLEAPAPYFVWGLIAVGLAMRAASLTRRPDLLREPADRSSALLVPLSTCGALFMLPDHGVGQLSVSLLLAASYYALEAYASRWLKTAHLASAHVLLLLSVATGVYALTDDRQLVVLVLMILTAAEAAMLTWLPRQAAAVRDMATVVLAMALAAVVLALPDGWLVSLSLLVAMAAAWLVAARQRRLDGFVGVGIALAALPLAVGQLALEPALGLGGQSAACFAAALVLLGLAGGLYRRAEWADWHEAAVALPLCAAVLAVLPAWAAGGWTALAGTLALALVVACLAQLTRQTAAWVVAGAVLIVPILLTAGRADEPVFAAAVGLALAANTGLAWYKRQEASRWLVSGLALLLPVALGNGALGYEWAAPAFAYAYLTVMAGLVVCRAVALRAAMTAHRAAAAPAEAAGGTVASPSYVAGYLTAAALALVISLATDASRLHTSVILAVLLAMSVLLSLRIESRREILVLAPWLAQALLASLIRPDFNPQTGTLVIVLSVALAALLYAAADEWRRWLGAATDVVTKSWLAAAYLPLWLGLFYEEEPMVLPFALAVAGGLTLHHYWLHSQAARELSGGIVVLALLWALSVAGADNLQVYTHIIAAVLGGYAYWRFRRQEASQGDGYLSALFLVATVPLVLQALGGASGDLYGWWLILQQVGFMILGITIRRRFLTWWGLYVSVAAVLYQLRHLGWAALTVLALFVIGVAVYRLVRAGDRDGNVKADR